MFYSLYGGFSQVSSSGGGGGAPSGPAGGALTGNYPNPELSIDASPTYGSSLPVTSGGVYTSLSNKMNSTTLYLEGVDLYYYSHSYGVTVAIPGNNASSQSMSPYRLGKRLLLTPYMRSNASFWSRDVSAVMFNGNGTIANRLIPGSTGIVIIDSLQNDFRNWITNNRATSNVNDLKNSLKAMCWYAMCSNVKEQNDASFTYSGTWGTSSQTWFSGGSIATCSNATDKVDIAVSGSNYILFSRGTNGAGGGGKGNVLVDAVLNGTIDNTAGDQAGTGASQTGQTTCPFAYPVLGLSNAAHTLTFQRVNVAGSIFIDCIGTLSTIPPLILLYKQVYNSNSQYATWGNNASNADVDTFNSYVDDVVTYFNGLGFNNVKSVDFNNNGWDRTTMISTNLDGHPNDRGFGLIANVAEASIRSLFTNFTNGYNRF